MKVGITGSQGFIGWHLQCFYKTIESVEIVCANRDTFSERSALQDFVKSCDVIIHLAGVNRASDEEILSGNINLAKSLINTCIELNATPHILFSSSTHVEGDSVYGKAKKIASDLFIKWNKEQQGKYTEMIIPHVFGEYGRPFYNSGVATFCHQIVKGEDLQINGNGQLELLHVQDLCEVIHQLIISPENSVRLQGSSISVREVVQKLTGFYATYQSGVVPDLSDDLDISLFNALRGAIKAEDRAIENVLHEDDRGWLVETVKVQSGGQCFVSSTKPGVTRGNHFHRKKFERFFVLKGKAIIRLRKLFTEDIIEYVIDGTKPTYVDIPTLHTHNITNIGDNELITLFWSNEIFDPENPDTYWEDV